MNTLLGLRVVESPMAYTWNVWHEVHALPIRKRRRGYRVVRCEKREPAMLQFGDVVYVPPEAMAQLRKATPPISPQFNPNTFSPF